jgi:hypothetical protein
MIMTGGYFPGHVAILYRLWLAFSSLVFPDGVKYRARLLLNLRGIFVEMLLLETIRHRW